MELCAKCKKDKCECKVEKALSPFQADFEASLTALEGFAKAQPPEKKDEKKDEKDKKKDEEEKADDGEKDEELFSEKSFIEGNFDAEGQEAINAIPILETLVTKGIVPIQNGLVALRRSQQGSKATDVLFAKALLVQGQALKSIVEGFDTLKAKIEEIAVQPSGRKSVVSVFEKSVVPDGGVPVTQDGQALLGKAVKASAQGKLNPEHVGIIQHHVNRGLAVPETYMPILNSVQ
jgi:hypothetical protein